MSINDLHQHFIGIHVRVWMSCKSIIRYVIRASINLSHIHIYIFVITIILYCEDTI